MANSAKVGGGILALSAAGSASASTDGTDGCGLEEPGRINEPAPEVQEFFDTFAANAQPIHELSTQQARTAYQNLFIEDISPEEVGNTVGNVENREIPGSDGNQIPIRIYTPEAGNEPFPVMVYFHGGGWVLGGLDTHDSVARSLTNSSEAIIVSVDHRLGPENPFAAAVRDAVAATKWVLQNAEEIGGDPEQVAIGGDPYITPEDATWFGERYLPYPEAAMNAYTSPLYYAPDLSGLPPATVMATGFGLWRNQSFAYAERLCSAGVDVEFLNYPSLLHDVMNMEFLPDPYPDIPQANQLFEDAGNALQSAFGQ